MDHLGGGVGTHAIQVDRQTGRAVDNRSGGQRDPLRQCAHPWGVALQQSADIDLVATGAVLGQKVAQRVGGACAGIGRVPDKGVAVGRSEVGIPRVGHIRIGGAGEFHQGR